MIDCPTQQDVVSNESHHTSSRFDIATRKIALPLAHETQRPYTLTMADFLEYVRRRQAELRKELEDLKIAERVYLSSRPGAPAPEDVASDLLTAAKNWKNREMITPRTVKQMILELLDQTYPGGLTALEILAQIRERWKPDLDRTTLSPQLTRLKRDKKITNDKTRWFLVVNETGASVGADAPAKESGVV